MVPSPLAFRRSMLKRISGFSILSFLGDIAERVLFKTDNIVVGAFLPESMVSAYAIPARLVDYPRQLVRRMSHTFSPRFALLSARGEEKDLRDLVTDTARWATLLMLPFACGLTFLGADFIEVWIGERLPDARWVLGFLCLAQLVRAPAIILAAAVWGTGQLRGATIAITSEAVANLLLSLWWIHTWGLPGVAAGTAVPALVYSFAVIPLILQSVTGMEASATMARVWRRPLLVALPSAVVYAILPPMDPVTVGGLIVRIGVGVGVSGLATWFLGLEASERRWLQTKLVDRWRRAS